MPSASSAAIVGTIIAERQRTSERIMALIFFTIIKFSFLLFILILKY
jgi:hypothetical protein